MLENAFKSKLKKKIESMFPSCLIFNLNAQQKQGISDMLILYKDKWAALEGKRVKDASHRPNQDYYVKKLNSMSFCRFIYPENEKEVLDELKTFFG